ncbi:MAG: hypothetical protein E7177_05480 [Erysipelotrichaceae bacterium]|nr:hypothetical protein [Erysipelotrichaceae bacterium]
MWFKKENKKYDEDIIDVEIDEEDEIYDNNEYVEGGINKNRKSTSKKTPFEEGMKDFEDAMNQLGETIAKGINKAKVWMNNNKNDKVTNRLVKILPFMDEEDVHEIVDKILLDDPDFKGVNVVAIMPFLDDEDCDKIFLKKLQEDDDVALELINFVSEECLSYLVDAYINGKYPDLDVDKLYPFLDGDDVKKLFYFELKKAKK